MLSRIRNEPALIGSLIESLIALAFAFGLIDWTGEQVGALMAVVAIVTGVGVRQAAYGPETVHQIEADQQAVLDDITGRAPLGDLPERPDH